MVTAGHGVRDTMAAMPDVTEVHRRQRAVERMRRLHVASRAKESAKTAAVGRVAMGLAGLILGGLSAGLLYVGFVSVGAMGGFAALFFVAGAFFACVALMLLGGAVLPERIFTPFADAVGAAIHSCGDLLRFTP